jgi:hypothetical protein
MGGVPDRPERHVNWAERHGRIRSKLLHPIDNPMVAAEHISALPQTKQLYKDSPKYYKVIPYRQAWNIIEDADPTLPKPKPIRPANTWDEPNWDIRAKAAAKFSIRWSEAEQQYIRK